MSRQLQPILQSEFFGPTANMQAANVGLTHRCVAEHQHAAIKVPGIRFFDEGNIPGEFAVGRAATFNSLSARHEIELAGKTARFCRRLSKRHWHIEVHPQQIGPHPHANRRWRLITGTREQDIDAVICLPGKSTRQRHTEVLY